jgi:DtxR family Mn-dependent transcriptional regulator
MAAPTVANQRLSPNASVTNGHPSGGRLGAFHESRLQPCLRMNGPSPTHLSRSVEDYLKAIYSLTAGGEAASTSALAGALEVQPASVTGMVKRLAETGYLEHALYRGARLTEMGTREALRIIRRHRILETYLYVQLGYSWDDVHAEAERLEHAASEALIDRMSAVLEHPTHDPHGAPIPTRSGEIEASDFATLDEMRPGATVQIRAVQDEDPERLRYMEALGLTPGAQVTVVDQAPYDGPLTVAVTDSSGTEVIGSDLAGKIFVAPIVPE